MKKPNSSDNPWRAVALTSAIGIDLAVCLGAGYYVGDYFSQLMGGGVMWILGGFMLGLVAAIGSIYFMIKYYGGL